MDWDKGSKQEMDFTLRPWRPEDAQELVIHANDPLVAQNLRDAFPHPYALADAEQFVSCCIAREGQGQLLRCIEVEGKAAGSIGLLLGEDVYRRSAELGYWLGRRYWRQGIMSRAAEQICREGFAAWDIVRIHAEPYAANAGSRGVLEKAGFRLVGVQHQSVYKNGALLDSCIYERLRETPD